MLGSAAYLLEVQAETYQSILKAAAQHRAQELSLCLVQSMQNVTGERLAAAYKLRSPDTALLLARK